MKTDFSKSYMAKQILPSYSTQNVKETRKACLVDALVRQGTEATAEA